MSARVLAASVLAALLHALAPMSQASPAVTAVVDVDASEQTQQRMRRSWEQFLDFADLEKVGSGFVLLEQMRDAEGEYAFERCAEHSAALNAALDSNPVSHSLWWVAYRCAEEIGDELAAEKRLDHLRELVAFSLQGHSRAHGLVPIRVASEIDADVFARILDAEYLYSYYDLSHLPGELRFHLALRDPVDDREHHFAFDYLDTLVRLQQRAIPDARYPTFRVQFAHAALKRLAESGGEAAADAIERRAAVASASGEAELQALAAQARAQDIGATVRFAQQCIVRDPDTDCADAAVDVLLPLAEAKLSEPLALLAHAHHHGRGVGRDRKAARALLAESARLSGGEMPLRYAAMACIGGADCGSELYESVLRDAAAEGDGLARLVQLWPSLKAKTALSDADRAAVLDVARSGFPLAQAMYGYAAADAGHAADALQWWARALEGGMVQVAGELAKLRERGTFADVGEATRLHRLAASSGDARSIRWLADRAVTALDGAPEPVPEWLDFPLWDLRRQPWSELRTEAERWLGIAHQYGDADAALDLAELHLAGRVRAADRAAAMQVLERVASRDDQFAARLRLLELRLSFDGSDADVQIARRLMSGDAAAGNADAQAALGRTMLRGEPDAVRGREGRRFLQLAMQAGDEGAGNDLANAYAYGIGGARDAARAREIWIELGDGNQLALNNWAWAACTSDDPAMHDPAAGAVVAVRLAKQKLPPSFLDTVAACAAANGDFERAVALQREALSELETRFPSDVASAEDLRGRLASYLGRTPFIERIER